MEKKKIILIVVGVVVVIGLLAFLRPPAKQEAASLPPAEEGDIVLNELGVSIILPGGLQGLVMGTTNSPVAGTVVSIGMPTGEEGEGAVCDLGSYYNVQKSALSQPNAPWKEEDLKAAAQVSESMPPQVKEFSDFYFVFEPAQAPCGTTPQEVQVTTSLRQALWIAVSTAKQI